MIFLTLLFLFWSSCCLLSLCMATAQTLPTSPTELRDRSAEGDQTDTGTQQAIIPSPPALEWPEAIVLTPQVARLPVELDVSIPVRNFRVRNLLALEAAHLIESAWSQGEDVPLAAGGVRDAGREWRIHSALLLPPGRAPVCSGLPRCLLDDLF